ncbi:MAG: hypothetical protein ACREU7_01115 [Burkholderiales bacterium]
MEKSVVIEIARNLLVAIQALSGYPAPEQLPEVHVVPQTFIAELVCKGPCRVQAFYHPDFGVFVDEKLRIDSDAYAQSILLHELVHHAQEVSGRFETLPSECHRRVAAESEAYEIQNKFLAMQQAPQRIPFRRFSLPCPDG